jgi:hypothetical protein
MKLQRVVVLLSAMVAVSLFGHTGAAAPAAGMVGVVDFYAPTPLGPFGFAPGRFAADDLSTLLTQAGAGRFTVVSRDSMERAEASLGWQGVDVLHFDRLHALARAVGANALIVGQILLLDNLDGGRTPPGATVETNLRLQIFDAAQGRIVAETRPSASVVAPLERDLRTKEVLHDALVRAVPQLVDALNAGSP